MGVVDLLGSCCCNGHDSCGADATAATLGAAGQREVSCVSYRKGGGDAVGAVRFSGLIAVAGVLFVVAGFFFLWISQSSNPQIMSYNLEESTSARSLQWFLTSSGSVLQWSPMTFEI